MSINALISILRSQTRAIYLLVCIAVAAGLIGLSALASGIYPEVTFPRVVVLVEAGDSAAQLLLPAVTRPIEESVSKIPGFRQVRTQTLRGTVETSIEFSAQTDIELALQQVRGRIGELRASFPPNSSVTIERLMPSVFPVLSYNLVSRNIPLPTLNDLALYRIRPLLLQVPGVAQVKVQSARSREFSVEIDPEKLSVLRLNLSQLASAIQQTNQVNVVGRSQQEHQQALILGTGEMFSAQQLEDVVVTTRGGAPVRLGQIAQVHEGASDAITAFSGNGQPAVLISVLKQPDANLLQLAESVKRKMTLIPAQLPRGIQIQPVYDLAQLVGASLENLRDAIVLGTILIFIVIFVFLRDWRSTLIAAITIPVTMAITFGLMALVHQTLNLMSLGGLAVAVGLVIDDAIVMIEGIFHKIQSGLPSAEATDAAVSELAAPIISSTVTTIVVFAPLGLIEGVVGQFFIAFCFTLSAAVLVSLVLALTTTPILCRRFLQGGETAVPLPANSRFDISAKIKYTLSHPRQVTAACMVLLLALVPLVMMLDRGFMPEIDEGSFVLDYFAPPGTSLADTDLIADKIEATLATSPGVLSWSRRTGARLALAASETSRGDILVRLRPPSNRTRSTTEVMSELRRRLSTELPGIDIELTQILQDLINDLADSPAPVAVKIYGDDPEALKAICLQVGTILKNTRGIVDVNTHTRPSATEQTIRVDPILAGRFGMTVADVLLQLQTGLLGLNATNVREQEKLIPVRVRYSDAVRGEYSKHPESMPIINTAGTTLPLKSLARIEVLPGSLEIRRENLAPLGLVTAHLEGRDLGSAMDDIRSKLDRIALPQGFYIDYGGQWASQQKAFFNLSLVLALAIMLVYLVLVIQFRSLVAPVPILVAVPLSLFGVVAGLLITHTALNISSFMGLILLVGLVVKNGIILLTRAQQLLAKQRPIDDALILAAGERQRPIMMTTICTLLGLLPLAFGIGSGSEMQKPLAIAVISGLTISTAVTLFITPAIFKMLTSREPRHIGAEAELEIT